MAKEDELFEGLQIMTPQELESSISSGETNTQDEGSEDSNPNEDGIKGNEGFITPINKTATDDDEDNTPSSSTSATTSTNEAIYQALIKEMVASGTLTVEEGEDASEYACIIRLADLLPLLQLKYGHLDSEPTEADIDRCTACGSYMIRKCLTCQPTITNAHDAISVKRSIMDGTIDQ